MIEHAARHSTSLARSDCKRVAYALGDRRSSRVEASFHYSLRCRRGHKEAFWRRFGLERCEVQELSEGPAYRVAAWHLGERPPLVFVNYIPRVTGQPSPALLRTRKQRLAAGNRYLGNTTSPHRQAQSLYQQTRWFPHLVRACAIPAPRIQKQLPIWNVNARSNTSESAVPRGLHPRPFTGPVGRYLTFPPASVMS